MSQILFYTGTKAQFDSLTVKNDNALYFLTDANKLYKGAVPFSQPVQAVDAFPATGENGTIYVNTSTHEARTWNGTEWTVLALATITSIGDNPADSHVPTAKAVKNYVDGQIAGVATGVAGAVANITYTDKSISVQKGSGDPVTTALSGLVDGASYDGATGVLTLTTNGGTPVTVNLPVENFLSAASFDKDTNTLTLTLAGGEKVTVDLAELVDTYTGAEGTTASVTIAKNGEVSAAVNVSVQEGNIISARNDGIYACIQWNELT